MQVFLLSLVVAILGNGVQVKGWNLIWSDDFDGNSVDTSKWIFQNGDGCSEGLCGWGNNELQWYQSENTKIEDGKLIIEAKRESVGGKEYTSSKLITKGVGDWLFGKIEIRAKLPGGQGIWPAIWMLPTNSRSGWPVSGEIDIMENIGKEPETVHMTLHYGRAWNDKAQKSGSYRLASGKFSDDFHVFTMEWKRDEFKFFVDGNEAYTVTASQVENENYFYPFNESPFHLILNVAVGGSWPGNPDSTTEFPQRMEIDYVKVYEE